MRALVVAVLLVLAPAVAQAQTPPPTKQSVWEKARGDFYKISTQIGNLKEEIEKANRQLEPIKARVSALERKPKEERGYAEDAELKRLMVDKHALSESLGLGPLESRLKKLVEDEPALRERALATGWEYVSERVRAAERQFDAERREQAETIGNVAYETIYELAEIERGRRAAAASAMPQPKGDTPGARATLILIFSKQRDAALTEQAALLAEVKHLTGEEARLADLRSRGYSLPDDRVQKMLTSVRDRIKKLQVRGQEVGAKALEYTDRVNELEKKQNEASAPEAPKSVTPGLGAP